MFSLPLCSLSSLSFLYLVCLLSQSIIVSGSVHAFYYLWYGNVSYDGRWKHWDHEVLPHWTQSVNELYPQIGTRHNPPDSIHSPYYPLRGPYSSSDPLTIAAHFQEMKEAGITVVVLSWWGQKNRIESTDTQGVTTDDLIPMILSVAETFIDLKISFHLEPYHGRTARSTFDDLIYIHENYCSSPSIYRINDRPVFYIYDSYHIPVEDWAQYFTSTGDHSIRASPYDSFLIGLWLDQPHGQDLAKGGFDGIYTYFASDGFSYGSNTNHWKKMCEYSKKMNMMCVLSVGPGYRDDKIRPWNHGNTKRRDNGNYYRHMWQKALEANPMVVSITSYNEWGEGTQIEPARRIVNDENGEYLDYEELESNGYLHLTREFANQFLQSSPHDQYEEL